MNNHVNRDGQVDEFGGFVECGGDGRDGGEVDIGRQWAVAAGWIGSHAIAEKNTYLNMAANPVSATMNHFSGVVWML